MDKSENLVARLLAVYAIILTLCIAIYAIFQLLEVDFTLERWSHLFEQLKAYL